LVADHEFSLPKEKQRTGFLGVFNGIYPGSEAKTLTKLVLGAIMDTAGLPLERPKRAVTQEERAAKRASKKTLTEWYTQRANMALPFYTKLTKVSAGEDSYFELKLPILHFNNPYSLSTAFGALGGSVSTIPTEAFETLKVLSNERGPHKYELGFCLQNARGISPKAEELFRQCVQHVEIESEVSGITFFIVFKIPKDVCEFLVNTAWLEIRPVDLYPLFSMWVQAEYDNRRYGKTSFPLSRISATLPTHDKSDERVDDYGITINMSGDPIWLPAQCDNTSKYEQKFNACGVREDGSFQLIHGAEGMLRTALPANIPILTDWVNYKFTFSNTAGRPETLPLEHFRRCTPSMAMNILRREVSEDWVKSLKSWAELCNISASVTRFTHNEEERQILDRYFGPGKNDMAVDQYARIIFGQTKIEGIRLRYMDLSPESEDPRFRPFGIFIGALHTACLENIEALYTKYSVRTVIDFLGYLSLVANYATKLSETTVAANNATKVYAEQGADPNWTPPPMPMVAAKMNSPEGGLLPHQARIRNMLRESPDSAVLAVPAGGGKSPMAITDVLQEISRGSQGPFILMCPSFLVANYVSEIVEFTDGKLNCIPVTSYNIRVTGLPRYEEILRAAPVNSVFVVDFNVVKYRPKKTVYGTTSTTVYPVVEMLRRFKPKYVLIDEVHLIKNANSSRYKAVMSLVTDIPKKRIASGTLNPDSPSDLPGQVAVLDPTILGSREDFNSKYGEEIRGGRVMKWRTTGQNSLSDVMHNLKQNVVWCQAKRKEWACALPRRIDRFIPVNFTPAQQAVYEAIFDDMVQSIKKHAETNKGAKLLLDKMQGKKASKEEEDQFSDMEEDQAQTDGETDEDLLDDEGDPGPSLQPYLADIERFVTNPMFHPYARNGFINTQGEHVPPLTGEDQKSPKILKLIERMHSNYHVLDPSYPKTLIFVNYSESASAVFDQMPPELQACGLLYTAANKTELVNKFKTDPKIRWMVGIRQSLEVGLNLQVANVLVRLDNVWTPGEQEQGDSRIARPYFGPGGDKRPELQFDTIVMNHTIDVTKAARLRAKIVAVAKFENTTDPAYQAIEDIPILPLTLDVIRTQNDFNTNLKAHAMSMAHLNQVIQDENESEKRRILSEGGLKFTQIPQAPTPPGCGLLSRVPYAQGTELYKASELGMVRVDNFLGMDLAPEGEDDETTGEEEDVSTGNPQLEAIMGLRCHTEQGDGYIIGASGSPTLRRVRVMCDDGTTIGVNVTASFIVTRTETNGIDMRNKLAEAAGLEVTGTITVPAAASKVTRETKKMIREREAREEAERQAKRKAERDAKKTEKPLVVNLQLNLVNGFMQVGFDPESNPKAAKALEAIGFAANPAYYYTQIRTFKQLIAQAEKWAADGFEIGTKVDNDTFQILAQEFASGGLRTHRDYARAMNAAAFRNYMRVEWKANSDKKLLNLFALITDGGMHNAFNLRQAEARSEKQGAEVAPNYGVAYLCMPAGGGHPGSRAAIQAKYKVPGTKWLLASPMLSKFVGSIAGVHKILEEIRAAGIKIGNIAELNQHARSVKKITPRTDDENVVYKDLREKDLPVVDPTVRKKRPMAVEPSADDEEVAERPARNKRPQAVPPRPKSREPAVKPRGNNRKVAVKPARRRA